MNLAKVVGNVVATQKNNNLLGKKLLLIQAVDIEGNFYGEEIIAVDGVGAGIGDLVLVIAEGGSARHVTKSKSPLAPIDTCIAGIVDSIKVDKNTNL
jgi:microcompartment protein CcmK/EutM